MLSLDLQDFVDLDEADKVPYIKDFAILYAQQFSREDLDGYCHLADVCRAMHKHTEGADFMGQLLRHRMVLNFFAQPSSRTFMSFNAAQTILGMKRMSVRDEAISSIAKGESLEDSIRTFISYVDLVVMRHGEDDAGDKAAWISAASHRRIRFNDLERPIPIISAGSGKLQHPTQALLDIYTLEKSFAHDGGIDGKTLMLVGDLQRGRTVRSLSYLMKEYKDVKLVFAAPPEYQMKDDILAFLDRHAIPYRMVDSIDAAIEDVDAVYMTRIQDEHDEGRVKGQHKAAKGDFIFRLDHLARMRDTAVLMHPLPKRDEIEKAVDFVDDPRVVYWRQERNGMWTRVAVLARLFGVEQAILDQATTMNLSLEV